MIATNKQERSCWLRAPRNGARGYIILFYRGRTRVAWHHESTGQPCELGRVVRSWVRENNLPSERMIMFSENSKGKQTLQITMQLFKEGAD